MEQSPKPVTEVVEAVENVENLSEWRELKDQAPAQAESLIGSINNFSELEIADQVLALHELLGALAEDNQNRYVANEIAKKISVLEITAQYTSSMDNLGVAA